MASTDSTRSVTPSQNTRDSRVDLIRRLMWAAKGAPCRCTQSLAVIDGKATLRPKYVCPRCKVIEEALAVPGVS